LTSPRIEFAQTEPTGQCPLHGNLLWFALAGMTRIVAGCAAANDVSRPGTHIFRQSPGIVDDFHLVRRYIAPFPKYNIDVRRCSANREALDDDSCNTASGQPLHHHPRWWFDLPCREVFPRATEVIQRYWLHGYPCRSDQECSHNRHHTHIASSAELCTESPVAPPAMLSGRCAKCIVLLCPQG